MNGNGWNDISLAADTLEERVNKLEERNKELQEKNVKLDMSGLM